MHFRASSHHLSFNQENYFYRAPNPQTGLKELMLSQATSLPPSPSRASYEPARRSDAPFYMHEDIDPFYNPRKSSADDMEAGCLVPGDADDCDVPDLTSKKTSRRGMYAAYRHWFRGGSTVHLAEKSVESRRRASLFERRLQTGSWCAMVVLLILTIYFLMRER
ncbi:hypothetical protein C8R43DRAFT_1021222 [Mycena crocata]|nr:hypothetical protein C8R43DRAFT_1021222 [Mycena crocata]